MWAFFFIRSGGAYPAGLRAAASGGQIGLPPAVTLAALYVGYRVMGVAGMIVFPLLSVFCCQIYRALMEKTPEGQNASSRAGKPERAN